jgi:hypothetical protein
MEPACECWQVCCCLLSPVPWCQQVVLWGGACHLLQMHSGALLTVLACAVLLLTPMCTALLPPPPPLPLLPPAGGFSVFAGVGERTREGNDLYREMIESVGDTGTGGGTRGGVLHGYTTGAPCSAPRLLWVSHSTMQAMVAISPSWCVVCLVCVLGSITGHPTLPCGTDHPPPQPPPMLAASQHHCLAPADLHMLYSLPHLPPTPPHLLPPPPPGRDQAGR